MNIRTLALSALLYAAPVHALQVHGGSWAFDEVLFASSDVHLVGGQGFEFTGYAWNARVDAADCAFGCAPRERVSLFMHVSGGDLYGIASLRDVEFTDVGGPNAVEQLTLEVRGTTRAPRLRGPEERTTSTVARIRGQFYHAEVPLAETVVEELRGEVVVTIHWHRPEWDAEHWYTTAIDYDVVPR